MPFAVAENAWGEWANAYYFLTIDADAVRSGGLPTRFIHSAPSGVFYPNFVFYGGGLFAVLAYPAALIGAWPVFLASIVAAYALAYLGAYWLLTALRVTHGKATALALVAAASPYTITVMYGRGAWAETLAVALVWLAVGCGAQFLRRPHGTTAFAAASTLSVCGVAVTHNISVLLGIPFLATIWLLLSLEITGAWLAAIRRWAALCAWGAAGVLISAAWLVPNLAYGRDTQIAGWDLTTATAAFDTPSVVLSPWLHFPPAQRALTASAYGTPSAERVFNQVPSLLIAAIVLATGATLTSRVLRRSSSGTGGMHPRWIGIGGMVVVAGVILLLMTNNALWEATPVIAQLSQFAMRLNPYLTIILVALAGLALRRPGHITSIMALALAAWYVGLAAYQLATARAVPPPGFAVPRHEEIGPDRPSPIFLPPSVAPVQFRILPERPLTTASAVVEVGADGRALASSPRPAGSARSNVVCSPFVAAETGSAIVGVSSDGTCIIRTSSEASAIVVRAAWPPASLLGIGITVVGMGLFLALLRAQAAPTRDARMPDNTS